MCKCLHGDVSLLCVRMGVLYWLPWQPSRLSIGKELVPGHRSPRCLYIPLLQMYGCFYSETIGSRKGTFHPLFPCLWLFPNSLSPSTLLFLPLFPFSLLPSLNIIFFCPLSHFLRLCSPLSFLLHHTDLLYRQIQVAG